MSKTKTTAKKFAAGVVSFAMSVSFVFGGAVAPAQAQTVEELTAQINSLLSTISALQAQLSSLQGGSSATSGSGNGFVFNVNLSSGDTGNDVMELQKFLNTDAATQVAVSGAGSPGNETSYFGPATKAAVIKFQDKYASEVLASVGLSAGTGYFGSSSRAKANALNASTGSSNNNGGGSVVVPTGNTVNVSLAASSPSQTVLVTGQAIGDLAHFTFTNTSATAAKVTNLKFNRTGISADSVLSNVYLFNGATRLTDAATVSTGVISFASPTSGLFTVPAGTSMTVSVRSDISGGAGQVVGVSLSSVESDVAVGGTFPIAAANHSIANGTMGTVALNYTGPSGITENPATEVRVFEASAVVSTNDARLESLTLENRGTSADGDVQNFKLYIDGVQVGSTVAESMNDKVVFDLSSNPKVLETGTRIVKVLADIVKGSSETYDFQIRRTSDIRVIDTEFTQPILATDTDGSFPVSAGTANTIAAGALSVTRASDSPSGDITLSSTNVLLGSFEFRATGEDIKIEALNATSTTGASSSAGVDQVKIFVNGSQVGSTKDIAANTASGTEFTFGSSFIAKAGEITEVDIYGDAKNAAGTDLAAATTIRVGLTVSASNTEGLSSGNTVSAISQVNGNFRTIAASSLTATKSTGFGGTTAIAGSNNVRLGSFVLSAGSAEGINVNSIVVNLTDSNQTSSITDLRLEKGGVTLGTPKSTPSAENSFSVNLPIAASDSAVIDVYANVKSGVPNGTIVTSLDTTSGGTGMATANSTTVGSDVTLQTLTIAAGTLTVTAGVSPSDFIALDGATNVHVGSFDFDAANSDFTLRELKVKVPADAATSVTNVTLKHGSSVIQTRQLSAPSGSQTHGTSTFSGMEFVIPESGITTIDVYVDIPTIDNANVNISGKAISVILDDDEGFKATDSAGQEDTDLSASGDLDSSATSGKGTVYVRHTIPTIASVALGSSKLENKPNAELAKFSITADPAGEVTWKKIVFEVNKSDTVTIGATTTLRLKNSSGTTVAGSFATTTGNFTTQSQALASDATTGNLIFVPTSEERITGTETYTLTGTVAGANSDGEYVSVQIAETSTSVTTSAFSGFGTADADESFVWSDKSGGLNSGTHSESSTDWTNDYLVETLPITIGTRTF
jgi:hypothetical protein